MRTFAFALLSSSLVLPAHASIIDTSNLLLISAPNLTITADALINAGLPAQIVFPERQGVLLISPLATDTGIIAAGTTIDSYFFGLNTFSVTNNVSAATSITFDGAVLGVVFQETLAGVASPNYQLTNFLGAPSVTYNELTCLFCGFETLGQQTSLLPDFLSISDNTIFFQNQYSSPGDYARVIAMTAPAPVPAPIVGAGLPGLLSALGGLWLLARRRQLRKKGT